MRLEQASKNIKYSIIAYVINNFLKFVVRLVFVKSLPMEYLGVNGLFTNLLAMLSLAELGIGPAIVYSLYQPLANEDIRMINTLMKILKKAYNAIGIIIIIAGISVLPWFDWFVKDNAIIDIHWFYMIFLLNTGASYFYSYKRNLLIADQKQYINSIYQSGGQIVLALLQIIALLIINSYWVYIILILLVTIVENYIVTKKIDDLYPYLKDGLVQNLDSDIKKTIIRNVKAMVVHKFGKVIVFSTANLVLAKFVGLIAVGLYSNYYMIVNTAHSFAAQIFSSITANIGNLVVTETAFKKQKIFQVTEFIVAWQAMIISCGFYVLFNILIELWIGREYLLDEKIVTWLIVNFYLTYMRKAVQTFRDAAGLFWNDRYKPVAEAVINLFASVYLTIHYGVIGVVVSGIISTLLTGFWVEPYILFRSDINIKLKEYFKDYFKYTAVTFLTAVFIKWLNGKLFNDVTIINFVLGVILWLLISNTVWIVLFRKREEMAYLRNIARDKFGMKFL